MNSAAPHSILHLFFLYAVDRPRFVTNIQFLYMSYFSLDFVIIVFINAVENSFSGALVILESISVIDQHLYLLIS